MTDTPDDAPPPPADQRLGTLLGDRLCTKCGYNLAGQTIVREPHYSMLMVRCPECGTVASLQEYPLLGRWASRWAIVLIGLWLLLVLTCTLIAAGMIIGISWEFSRSATDAYATHLAAVQRQWIDDSGRDDLLDAYGLQHSPNTAYTRRADEWWQAVDIDQVLADAGGTMTVTDWTALWELIAWSLHIFIPGWLLALMVPHVRRRMLPMVAIGIGALALGMVLLFSVIENTRFYFVMADIAHEQIGERLQLLGGVIMLIPLTLGLLFGRPLTRLMVRLLLPPRMRGALAGLWRIDGLDPPRTPVT